MFSIYSPEPPPPSLGSRMKQWWSQLVSGFFLPTNKAMSHQAQPYSLPAHLVSGGKDKLDRTDPVGWYLCQVADSWRVIHWDGYGLDDSLPHMEIPFTRSLYAGATHFRGPMVFVDIDFP